MLSSILEVKRLKTIGLYAVTIIDKVVRGFNLNASNLILIRKSLDAASKSSKSYLTLKS